MCQKIINVNPRPYQKLILDNTYHLNAVGYFLGTGAGKTLISLMRFNELPTSNILVICPSKVVFQWIAVIESHTEILKVCQYKKSWSAKRRFEEVENQLKTRNKFNAIVFSLESMASVDFSKYLNDDWTIVVDESHKIKELGTKRKPVQVTQAVLALRDCTPYKMILTATPTQKAFGGYIDYYTQLYFLGYIDYPISLFKSRYCIMDKMQIIGMPYPISVIKGYTSKIKEIDNLVKNTCVSYTPKFTDGEPEHIPVWLEKPTNYNRVVKGKCYGDLDLTNLSARRLLKKTLCTGVVMGHTIFKEPLTIEDNTIKIDWLREFISNTDEKLFILYNFNPERDTLIKLCKELGKKYIVISGEVKNKYKLVNDSDYDIVIGQFRACGESIDGLQYKSHICIYFSLPESSIEYKQALGRINRDGQKYLPIYYYLITKGTIEEEIWKMIENKIEYNEKILDELVLKELR